MIILDDLKDINAVYGILEKIGSEVNNYYWHNNSEVDYERAGELHKLEKHLIERGYIDSDYDLAQLTYKFLDLYPQSITTQENNRQYHEVLNKLDERVQRELFYEIRMMEKDSGERLDKSVKFNMALDYLLKQYEFSEEVDDD
tara:strand:+ start:408 stop:836 length:429 start_codon:yes stop_codon:yes gene_type:complete